MALALVILSGALDATAKKEQQPPPGAKAFTTQKVAAAALVALAATNNVDALIEILGTGGEDLMNAREIVKEMELFDPDETWRPVEEK